MKTTLFTTIALVALLLAGCSGSGDIGGIDESRQSIDLTALPSETELQSRLDLSDTQAEAMGVLLANWRGGMQGDANAEPGAGMAERDEHMLAFIESAAGVLDRDQLVALLAFLAERRETMQGQGRPLGGPMAANGGRGPGMGQGNGGGHGNGMGQGNGNGHGGQGANGRPGDGEGPHLLRVLEQLDLSEAQQTAIQEFLDEYRESHEAPPQGDQAGRREFMEQMRADFREFLATVLTEDQLAELESLHDARRLERIAQRLANLDEHFARRVEFITTVLQLDADQSAAFAELSAAAVAQMRGLLESADEDTDFDALREAMQTIREETDTALRALLDAGQLEVLDALQELMHRGPGH